MAAVRDTAVVRPVGVVDGSKRRRQKPRIARMSDPMLNPPVERIVPDLAIMDMVKQVRRTGEVLVVMSPTRVMLVPEQFRMGPPQGWMPDRVLAAYVGDLP